MKRFGSVCAMVAMAGVLVGVVACGGGGTQDPAALEGGEWRLVASSVTDPDLAAAGITVSFDGAVAGGFSGVNQYSGAYEADDTGSLAVGMLTTTLIAGPEPLMEAEARYQSLISAAASFEASGDRLTITTADGDTLTYER